MNKDSKIYQVASSLVVILGIVIIILIMIGGYKLERWVNYKMDYGKKVEHTVYRVLEKEGFL